jgi:rhodanese-related sulfurtransferase
MKSILVCILTLVFACSAKNPNAENLMLKPTDFQAKLRSTPGAILLDVRTPEEVGKGYIKGALNMDFKSNEFKILIAGLDKTKPYFIYCAAGVRSGKAADMMADMDFQKVYTLEGGIDAWKAAALPVKIPPASTE